MIDSETLLKSVSFKPNLFNHNSAWKGHLPFAYWLTITLKPSVFVELGAHWGHSYFAFCQSVSEHSLLTKCYAIDTWQGEEHSGYYNDEVFNQVSTYNQDNFANFSCLLRMQFDEANNYFAENSIDLLHIDGFHTYEAVKHDFETWLPKLAPGAIVLLHDTNVRERGFGVWKLWEELQGVYSSHFEFVHSYGLGVLQINGGPEEKRLKWLLPASPTKNLLKVYFAELGNRQQERFELFAKNKTIAERDGQICSLNHTVAERDGEINSLNHTVAERDGEINSLNHAVAEKDGEINSLNHAVAEKDGQINSLNHAIAERDGQINSLNHAIAERDGQLSAILSSRSWKFSSPLRLVKQSLARGIRIVSGVLTIARHYNFSAVTKAICVFKSDGFSGLKHSGSETLKLINQTLINKVPNITVDVIVPVYRNVDYTRRCIESLRSARCKVKMRVVIINDASPEVEITEYLSSLKNTRNFKIITHNKNLGFVGTVNSGMLLGGCHDVLLLNSDTEVADGWLDRLVLHAYASPEIGSVTPFSNNATICSYPTINGISLLPQEETLESMNQAFYHANQGKSVYIPTAVGFCMFIRRKCLDDVGLFDEEAFGKGYGEENDFCLRAAAKGWRHLLATDTYVYHAGEISFKEESTLSKIRAKEIILQRYPDYEHIIAGHITAAEAEPYRVAATASRFKLSGKPVILFVGHNFGGGTEKHWIDLAKKYDGKAHFILLKPVQSESNCIELNSLNCHDALHTKFVVPDQIGILKLFLDSCGVTRIHIHHLVGIPQSVCDLIRESQIQFDFTVHDYFSICPQINLAIEGRYCGEPDFDDCNTCIARKNSYGASEIIWWRQTYAWVLQDADRVICPSEDTANRILKYHPTSNIIVAPHELISPAESESCIAKYSSKETLRIVILGWLAMHKGAQLVASVIQEIELKKLNIHITLIGSSNGIIDQTCFYRETGEYSDEELQYLIRQTDPHVIWLASTWPETYSYTLSAAIASGRPVCVPNIGAFPERTSSYTWSWTYPWDAPPRDLANFFIIIAENLAEGRKPDKKVEVGSMNEFYEKSYLVYGHTNQNYPRDLRRTNILTVLAIIETSDIGPSPCAYIRILLPLLSHKGNVPINLRVVKASEANMYLADFLICHRVSVELSQADTIISHCSKNRIPLIYDIDDDLIGIAESDHPESAHYAKFVPGIKMLMNLASCVTVSTKLLSIKFEKYSDNIKIIQNQLNRVLWDKGCVDRRRPANYISILYMGTQTHDGDLNLIIPAIRKIKNKYSDHVKFYIIGVTSNREHEDICNFICVPALAGKSYPGFVNWLNTLQFFDIGLAPLVTNDFNSCKSAIKFLDYSALGLASICSNVPAYQDFVKSGVNGLLVDNIQDKWENSLAKLIDDNLLQTSLAKAAKEFLWNKNDAKDFIDCYLEHLAHNNEVINE